MSSNQRYSRVAADDENDDAIPQPPTAIPSSPPPSFRSRRSSHDEAHRSEAERNLDDAFDAPSDDEDNDRGPHDQRRLISSEYPPTTPVEEVVEETGARPTTGQRRVTEIPVFAPSATGGRAVANNSQSNDGVWANLNAKPRAGEDLEEKPPTYEQAAADATPPYWETTVLSPYHTTGNPDDVFVDGLLVGSLFSFVWNGLISMSFQLIGFLLTYLLHTTHAAKHGSRAGLGITLVQYGFQMRYASSGGSADPNMPNAPTDGVPQDPNAHDFDPNQVGGAGEPAGASGGLKTTDMISYVLMIVGWFILIRAVSDFMRARRQEQLVRSSPDRGLGVAVVAEGEQPETSV
ncbi:hypothetical protein LTR53_009535 [Teratosphaeriaceae sp. CCFEE 6253]|nr:hypothetical protein LTR53_009535 [Teratosphaeriaceae sp. CCFEE 6253]